MTKQYTNGVITKDRKGNDEVRVLIERGEYVKYHYVDPKTEEILEKGKKSIILKTKKGNCEHLFLIPMSKNKSLMIKPKSEDSKDMLKKKIWNKEKNKEEDLF